MNGFIQEKFLFIVKTGVLVFYLFILFYLFIFFFFYSRLESNIVL